MTSRLMSRLGAALLAVSFATHASADEAKKLRIIFVSSLGSAQPFYLPIRKGFALAGDQLGVEAVFRGNQDSSLFSDPSAEKRLLENAIATKPDGLIISDTFPDVLADDIKAAIASGIPVVLTNTGFGQQKNVGALAFVGTDEHSLGWIGASKLAAAGAKNILVVTTPPGAVPFVDDRMAGIAQGVGSAKTTIVAMPLEQLVDQTKVVNTMVAAVQKDPTIDAIL
jgi:simple sugar transport system substrate-binding protein